MAADPIACWRGREAPTQDGRRCNGTLAPRPPWWQAGRMADDTPRAAGMPLALAIMAGAGIGAAFSQPTIGLLVGTAAGAAFAVALWRRDRRRRGR